MNLSEANEPSISKGSAERQHYTDALAGIAATIKADPDIKMCVKLRQFLWSLYNQHHLLNLWQMAEMLDSEHAAWISDVFTAAMSGILQESNLKEALITSGEMDRWENQPIPTETLQRFVEAQQIVESLIRTLPPGFAHTELARLHREFAVVEKALRESTKEEGRIQT